MWGDDPWAVAQRMQAQKCVAVSLAHRLDDVTHRARTLATNRMGKISVDAIWEAVAATRAQNDIDDVVVRLEDLNTFVWNSVG